MDFGAGSGASDIGNGINQIYGGLFGNSGAPFKDARKMLEDYLNQGKNTQNPFYQLGVGAIPDYKNWVSGMKDPSGFINNLMGQYSESPWAKYQQDQSSRRFGNGGSASGLTGSTPLLQDEQQNMHDISSEDQQKWLQNVLGINTEYGKGLNNELGYGQHAADQITDLLKSLGIDIAGLKGSETAAKNKDRSDLFGGIFNTGMGAAKMYAGGM